MTVSTLTHSETKQNKTNQTKTEQNKVVVSYDFFERSIFLKLLDSNCVMICLESTVEIYQYHTIDLAAPNQEITIIKME